MEENNNGDKNMETEEFERRIINIVKNHTKDRKWSKASQIRACKKLAECECADKYPNGHRIVNIHKPHHVSCSTCSYPPADTRYLVNISGMRDEIELLVYNATESKNR